MVLFSGACCVIVKGGYISIWGDRGVVGFSLQTIGMGDILVQQDFSHTGLKMSVLGLNTQLIDVVKDVLSPSKIPKQF